MDNLRTGKGNKLNNTAINSLGGFWLALLMRTVELSYRETRFKQTAPSNNEVGNEFTNEQIIDQIKEFHGSNDGLLLENNHQNQKDQSFYSGENTFW